MTRPDTLSDEQLNTLITSSLGLVGVDLDQLPANSADPVTGSPSRQQALSYLRSLLRGTAVQLSNWSPPPSDPALNQQVGPPALYPSITDTWTRRGP